MNGTDVPYCTWLALSVQLYCIIIARDASVPGVAGSAAAGSPGAKCTIGLKSVLSLSERAVWTQIAGCHGDWWHEI